MNTLPVPPLWLALSLSTIASAVSMTAAAQAPAQPAVAPDAFVNALEGTFGRHDGARRSHAKGVCAYGHFVGSAAGRDFSSASVFSGERVPVIARFSVGGGNPAASDKSRSVRGLALAFELPNNERWLTANLSAPVFFVGKPEHFVGFIESRRPDPATGRADPARVKAFNDAHPDTKPQIEWLAANPVPASYAGIGYFSTHAFRFTDRTGVTRFARWQFDPVMPVPGLSDEALKSASDHFLVDELRQRVATAPVEFRFRLQLAEAGDDTTSPVAQWPATRTLIDAGRLVIDRVAPDAGGACVPITFDPLVLPKGIAPSDDPVLLARSAPYVVSLARRLAPQQGEKAQ